MYEIGKMPASIDIGYTGEQEFRTVQIDMSEWVAKVPGATPILMYIRPGESEPYPVEITYEDYIITWSVTDGDLGTKEGTGLLQVWFGVQDEEQVMRKLGMSSVVTTIVHLSVSGGANASTVQIPWLKEIMEMKNIILGYDYEAEAWAVGQRGGEDVPATDASYHNNAKYYSDQAEAAKTAAQTAQAACETEVSRQLSEIISNPDSPPLDRTLSSNVSAAPADMVGDLKSAINKLEYFEVVPSWTDGHFIKWVDGTIGDSASYSYCYLTVTNEFAISVHTYFPSGIMGIAFYDKNDAYIYGYKNPTNVQEIDTVLRIPEGTAKIGISCLRSNVNSASFKTFADVQINEMSDLLKDIETVLTYKQQIDYTVLNGYYAVSNKIFNSSDYWSAALIEVSPGDEYYVTATSGAGNTPLAIFYNDTPSANSYIGYFELPGTATTYTDKKISIPTDAKYMGLSNMIETTPYMIIKKDVLGIEQNGGDREDNSGKIAILLNSNGTISIKPKKHDLNNDLMITMGHTGGNSLFDFMSIATVPNDGEFVSLDFSNATNKFTNPTDWLMSIKCRAVNNIDGDNPNSGYFTGGNHRSNNTGSGGVITAVENDIAFYADGNEITETAGMYCNELRIEWNNSVQGYNTTKNNGTGRYIFKQYYSLLIDRTGKMNITIRLVPMEAMVLEAYYGFGWYCSNGDKYWYKGSNAKRGVYTIGTDTENSGDLFATEMVAENDIVMHFGIDRTLDLGRLNHIGENTYNYFNYLTKMYPMVVYEDVNMGANENWYLGGYYYFE